MYRRSISCIYDGRNDDLHISECREKEATGTNVLRHWLNYATMPFGQAQDTLATDTLTVRRSSRRRTEANVRLPSRKPGEPAHRWLFSVEGRSRTDLGRVIVF